MCQGIYGNHINFLSLTYNQKNFFTPGTSIFQFINFTQYKSTFRFYFYENTDFFKLQILPILKFISYFSTLLFEV